RLERDDQLVQEISGALRITFSFSSLTRRPRAPRFTFGNRSLGLPIAYRKRTRCGRIGFADQIVAYRSSNRAGAFDKQFATRQQDSQTPQAAGECNPKHPTARDSLSKTTALHEFAPRCARLSG